MIRLALAGGGSTLFVLGITDMNVDRMTRCFPILVDLEPLGAMERDVAARGGADA